MARVATHAATALGALDPAQLGRLVDQLPVILWSADPQLRVTSRRGGSLSLLGLPPIPTPDDGVFVGRTVENPAESARAVAAHRAALLGNST
ncbi:MAG TPA: hypothetical protein VN803_05360, partial [Gemmatimonadales bacterium]|nr:hypothetical protein [Gemmatimonadales bacterium]